MIATRVLVVLLAWMLAAPATVSSPTLATDSRQQAMPVGPRPPSPVRLAVPSALTDRDTNKAPTVGQAFTMSFCDPAPANVNDLCQATASNPSGGHGPYHFQLDTMGGFPPMGLVLHPNGLLTGTPKAAGAVRFSVCAVDLDGSQNCQPVEVNVQPATAAKARKGSSVAPLIGVAVAAPVLAVSAVKLAQLSKNAGCGNPPSIPSSCLGIGRSSSCNAIIDQYATWCSCQGRTFDTATGSCR